MRSSNTLQTLDQDSWNKKKKKVSFLAYILKYFISASTLFIKVVEYVMPRLVVAHIEPCGHAVWLHGSLDRYFPVNPTSVRS